jgi:hypothetical protein
MESVVEKSATVALSFALVLYIERKSLKIISLFIDLL